MDLELTEEERRLLAADERSTARFGIWMVVFFGSLAASILLVAGQALAWLKAGVWPALTLRSALAWAGTPATPHVGWVGLQRIMDWTLDCPIAGVLLAVAIGVVFWVTRHDRKPEPEALRTARMKQARRAAGWTG